MNHEIIAVIEDRLSEAERQILFVCGIGGAGKSRFCDYVQERLSRDCVIVRHDWYLTHSSPDRRSRIQQAINAQDAEAIEREGNPINWYDSASFKRDLTTLRNLGRLQLAGVWNQQSGEKDLSVDVCASENAVVICDGIYLLDPSIRGYADAAVLLDISPKTARQRAGERDRHRSPGTYLSLKESLMEKYDLPYFEKYRRFADIVIDNNDFAHPNVLNS